MTASSGGRVVTPVERRLSMAPLPPCTICLGCRHGTLGAPRPTAGRASSRRGVVHTCRTGSCLHSLHACMHDRGGGTRTGLFIGA
ncbi:hypothetical protein ACJX0J_038612, partial [Zea mays]